MPTSFLDLPREVRDIIYSEFFTSPTSHLLIELHMKPRTFRQASSRGIRLQPCLPTSPLPRSDSLPYPVPTALERTCQQIYSETHDLLWEYNTICFESPWDVMPILKHMGQRASRLIQRANFHIGMWWALRSKEFRQALCMLASRTRQGNLREVRLVLHASTGATYMLSRFRERGHSMVLMRAKFETLQRSLRAGGDLVWAKGILRCLYLEWDHVETSDFRDCFKTIPKQLIEEVAMDFHHAWGGKLICGGVLVWNDYEKVGQVPDVASEASSKSD
jgi:hypothetical protein